MQRPLFNHHCIIINQEITYAKNPACSSVYFFSVASVVKFCWVLNELAVVQHTHPNPPFEKGGRNGSEEFSPLEEIS